MSRVFEAVDLKYDRPAAVKVLARWLANDDEFRQRFERESYAAERVTHPHVLPVWDYGEQEGLLYLATPLCDNDLGHLLGERKQLEPEHALTITRGLAKEPAHRFATCRELVAAAETSLRPRPTETAVDVGRPEETEALDATGTIPSPAESDVSPTAPEPAVAPAAPSRRRRR